ncbi:MAG TPA: hypothetical protein VLL05_01980 [Terriglobales bacterium]|nr:hypothetical protein [Terriglobales bacterium]
MTSRLFVLLALSGMLFSMPVSLCAQTSEESSAPQCQHASNDHASHDHDAMMGRGEKGMGFSQTKTTHHFLLTREGGVIAVSANDAKDSESREQIRMHLMHIARSFSEGNFDIPMFVHDQVPPGVEVMKKHAREISYQFKQTPAGGRVMVSSSSTEAIQAIHDFLVFQIQEHKTGDPTIAP